MKISIQSGKKLQKYCEKNDSLEYLSKMSYLLPKNLLRVSGNPCSEKNLKITFSPRALNMVKMGSEIYKYLLSFSSIYKYLVCFLSLVFNWSPQFYSHHACKLLDLQLIFFLNLPAAVDCVQLVPKYYSKVKLRSWRSTNISV